jgi:hypothetical protein
LEPKIFNPLIVVTVTVPSLRPNRSQRPFSDRWAWIIRSANRKAIVSKIAGQYSACPLQRAVRLYPQLPLSTAHHRDYRTARGAERDRSATCAVRDAYPQFQSTRACVVEPKHPSNQAADNLSAPVNSHQETLLSNPFPIGKSRPKRVTTDNSLINELDLPAVLPALEPRQCRHTHGVSFADARNQTPLATPERNAGTARVRKLEVRSCGTANNDASRGAAIVDPMAVTSRIDRPAHEIRGAGETSEIAAHLLRWRAHPSADAWKGCQASERRHAHFRMILFI